MICIIDSYDDIPMAAWCQLKNTSQSELRTVVDDLQAFFHQLGKFLRDPEGWLQKIFAFGTTRLPTLFTGIPLQELTGNVKLRGLFGLRDSDLEYLVGEVLQESRKERFMEYLRRTCRQYSFLDQSGEVSESVFYPREIISQIERTYQGVPNMPNDLSQNHRLAESVCDFIKIRLR